MEVASPLVVVTGKKRRVRFFARPSLLLLLIRLALAGVTGYLAGHVVQQLLAAGFRVRGTTRNPSDTKKLSHLTAMLGAAERLQFVKAELDDPVACVGACDGADYVIHCASPYTLSAKDPVKDLVEPAVNGAVNFLHAAHASGTVKRVVMTSSMAAITEHPVTGHVFTEADWNTASSVTHNPYFYSKTAAEKAAWEYADRNKVDLVVINPYIIMGAALNAAGADNPSLDIILRLSNGSFPGIFSFHWGIVDVADVAEAHVAALTSGNAKGRYLCVGGAVPMKRVVHLLKHHFPELPINDSELDGSAGTALLKLGSYFETKDVGQYMRSNVGQLFEFDNSKIKTDLEMEFRTVDETILSSVKTLIKWGRLPAMTSLLSPLALAQVARELNAALPAGVAGAGEVISWLIERSQYQSCPTRAVRDAEALQRVGVLVSSKSFSSILPTNLQKMLLVDVVAEAAKLGQFSIIYTPSPEAVSANVSQKSASTLPAEYQAIIDQCVADLLEAESGGIANGWTNVKTEMGATIQKKKSKGQTTQFKGTTAIKYPAQLIQEQSVLLESLPSIDPLFQSGEILQRFDEFTDIRLLKYEGRSCLVVSYLSNIF